MLTRHKKCILNVLLFLSLLIVLTAAVAFGSAGLSFGQIIDGLAGKDSTSEIIIKELRMPRVIGACLAGIGLSTAGLVLQTVTDNSLCAPNIIGINAGAGFAVMLFSCFFPMLYRLYPIAAFLGALATALTVTGISGTGGFRKTSVVLSGVAVSAMLNGGISFLSLKYPDAVSSYLAFSVGGFNGVRLRELLLPALIIAVCILLTAAYSSKIQLLCLGDEMANTLGIRARNIRIIGIALASALAASAVSYAGLIGFVGLVVPHISRRIAGSTVRELLLPNALLGAILVILSDLSGRVLFSPGEIPAGIIMSFIGAPFFLSLLIGRRNEL